MTIYSLILLNGLVVGFMAWPENVTLTACNEMIQYNIRKHDEARAKDPTFPPYVIECRRLRTKPVLGEKLLEQEE